MPVLYLALFTAAFLFSCGESKGSKKSASGPIVITINPSDLQGWKTSESKLNGTKDGSSARSFNSQGLPIKIENFDGNNAKVSEGIFEYNDRGSLLKSTQTVFATNLVTRVEYSYDTSGRRISEQSYSNNRLIDKREYNYTEKKITFTTYDSTSNDTKVLEVTTSTYAIAEINHDGSPNFFVIVQSLTNSTDGTVKLETTSNYNGQSEGQYTLINKDLITGRIQSETVIDYRTFIWKRDNFEVTRIANIREKSWQSNAEGVRVSEQETSHSYNSKFVLIQSYSQVIFPTKDQVNYDTFKQYEYDASDLNIVLSKERVDTKPESTTQPAISTIRETSYSY